MPARYRPVGVSEIDSTIAAPTPVVPPGPVRTEVREDLNGLRGVAIALVVVFHVWLGRVSGGVDVFLTLSGFFFTASLMRTAASGGLLDPFVRVARILRRLGPPLILVLAAVGVATVVILPRTRWVDIGNQLISGVLFFANWELASTSADYLAADPTVSPLQHLWSVAVQFQFYLLAIGVVFGLAAILRSSRGGHRFSPHPRIFVVLFTGAAVLSFVYAADGVARHQAWNYYDTAARLWEILLGSAVAAYFACRPNKRDTAFSTRAERGLRSALAVIGLLAIAVCGFLFDGVEEFPGPWALFPVLATLALIAAGPDTSVARVLSTRFGVWIGTIAFPLYLWHWPLLIFTLALTGETDATLLTGAAVIGASVLLAMLTVRAVERPMLSAPGSIRARAIAGAAAAMAAVVVCASLAWDDHVDKSVAELQESGVVDAALYPGARALTSGISPDAAAIVPDLFSAPEDVPATTLDGCIADFDTQEALSCEYGDVTASRTIALAGGSHAEHWLTALDVLGREHGFRVVTFVKMGCPLTTDYIPVLFGSDYVSCLNWSRTALDRIAELQPDFVFTTSTRPKGEGVGDESPDWYVEVWRELSAQGIPVLAMRDNPWLTRDGVEWRAIDCLAEGGDATSCGVRRSVALDPVDPTLAAAFQMPSVRALDMTDSLCDERICRVVEGNVLIFRDEHHLTATYVRTMAPELGKQIAAATGWW